MSLTFAFDSCGGGAPPDHAGVSQPAVSIEAGRKASVLKAITIAPNNPVGISAGTQLQFTATGSYVDNSVQDLTTLVVWTSADTSVATVSNEPGSMGIATAISKGYCSISATLGSVSDSIVIGVN